MSDETGANVVFQLAGLGALVEVLLRRAEHLVDDAVIATVVVLVAGDRRMRVVARPLTLTRELPKLLYGIFQDLEKFEHIRFVKLYVKKHSSLD